MEARNTRPRLLLLHSEMEALIWTIKNMRNLRQYHVTFATDCIPLVKMIYAPEILPVFTNYLDDIKILQGIFSYAKIIHIPRTLNTKEDSLRTLNTKEDSLVRSAKKQSFFIVHMDAQLPI